MTAGIRISDTLFEVGETYTLSFTIQNLEDGEEIYQLGGHSQAFETLSVSMDGVDYEGDWASPPIRTSLGYDEHKVIVKLKFMEHSGNSNLYIQPNRNGTQFRNYHALIKDININKGTVATDWTPAPEDNYTQEEFKIFESTYDESVRSINSSLTALENDKLDGSTYTTFYKQEFEQTAAGAKEAYEKVVKIVDENGNTTDTFAQAVYERNATRRTESFDEVTKDLVKEATYTAGINGLSGSITTIQGNLDKLQIGSRNLVLESDLEVANSGYSIKTYKLSDVSLVEAGKYYVITIIGELVDGQTGWYLNLHQNTNGTPAYPSMVTLEKGDQINNNTWSKTFKVSTSTNLTGVIGLYALPLGNGKVARVNKIKLSKGNIISTDWTPAPEDMLGQADFQVFKTTYEANDKLIKARLLAIDSSDEGSVVTRL
uniref:hypothetical protein n=1 Tax=Aerococcus urinaeequi TaxID=51665 RepID=UPI00352BC13F